MNAYRYLAQAYNKLMSDVDYDAWASYIDLLLGKKELRIFEASCGTGNISSRLYDLGHNIIASDISSTMLDIAIRDARQNGREIVYVQQDMRQITAGKKFDAVLSACDGANYVDKDGLRDFFSAAYHMLKPGGKLLFDVSSYHKLSSMNDEVYYDDGDEATCIWHNHFDFSLNKLTMDVVLFMQRGELFEKLTEQHIQYAHEKEDIEKVLISSGFSQIDVYEAFTKKPVSSKTARLQFVCGKD